MREGPGKVKRERARKCGPASFTKDDGAQEGAGPGGPRHPLTGAALAGQVVLKPCRLGGWGGKMAEVYEIKSNRRLQRRGS